MIFIKVQKILIVTKTFFSNKQLLNDSCNFCKNWGGFLYWHRIFPPFLNSRLEKWKARYLTSSMGRDDPLGSLTANSNCYSGDKHKLVVIFEIQTYTIVKGKILRTSYKSGVKWSQPFSPWNNTIYFRLTKAVQCNPILLKYIDKLRTYLSSPLSKGKTIVVSIGWNHLWKLTLTLIPPFSSLTLLLKMSPSKEVKSYIL